MCVCNLGSTMPTRHLIETRRFCRVFVGFFYPTKTRRSKFGYPTSGFCRVFSSGFSSHPLIISTFAKNPRRTLQLPYKNPTKTLQKPDKCPIKTRFLPYKNPILTLQKPDENPTKTRSPNSVFEKIRRKPDPDFGGICRS